MKKGKKAFWTVVVAVVVVLAILLSLNHFYVDYLWFSEMGYLNVFLRSWSRRCRSVHRYLWCCWSCSSST